MLKKKLLSDFQKQKELLIISENLLTNYSMNKERSVFPLFFLQSLLLYFFSKTKKKYIIQAKIKTPTTKSPHEGDFFFSKDKKFYLVNKRANKKRFNSER